MKRPSFRSDPPKETCGSRRKEALSNPIRQSLLTSAATVHGAFLWHIWRRQRGRIILVVVTLGCFALFYSGLCRYIGLDLNAPNALDNLVPVLSRTMPNLSPLARVFRIVLVLFLLLGPLGCMVVSQLYAIWIFTFAELDEVRGFAMPTRLFRLPISPNFFAAWLMAFGAVAITLLYLGWTHLVHLPRIEVFNGFPNLLVWLTLLWVSQAIFWSLDAFPIARIIMLAGVIWFIGYLAGPSVDEFPILATNKTWILLALAGLGWLFGFVGLNKIRQGDWQTIPWRSWHHRMHRFVSCNDAVEQEATEKAKAQSGGFGTISAAQLWFEWRKSGRNLLFSTCGLVAAGLLVMTVVSIGIGGLSEGDLCGLLIYLLAVPLFVHFLHGVKPETGIPQFIATHPLTAGDIRKSLRRQLVTRAALLKYAAAWLCLAVVLILLVLVASDANWWRVSICLGILIALPLARMSFYPLLFQSARHQ